MAEPDRDEDVEKAGMAAIEEARMVLPGIQALFGFQLIAAFNQRFLDLSAADQRIHLTGALLVVAAIVIIMTPAAYHRIVERGRMSAFFVKLASILVALAMVPLSVAIAAEVYVVCEMILDERSKSVIISCSAFGLLLAMWFAFPLLAKGKRVGR